MLTQLDLLTKHIMGGNQKSVNAIGVSVDVVCDNVPYEGGQNEEVHYMGNHVFGSQLTFPKPPKKQPQKNDVGGKIELGQIKLNTAVGEIMMV